MARVVVNSFLADHMGDRAPADQTELELDAGNVRSLIKKLDGEFPGLADKLSSGTAVAIDGEIFQEPMLESLEEDSEVYFLPAIEGG